MDTRTGLPVVGMVGGGELARMTHQAAIALGQSLKVLATSEADAAALVAADAVIGSQTDLAALRAFAQGCDVVTFGHEHVPAGHIRELVSAGVTVRPGAGALLFARNKRAMRERLGAGGVPVPRWAPVRSAADLDRFAARTGWPVVVKAERGGHDGRGVWFLNQGDALPAGVALIVEERVPLRRELAAVVARSPFGQVAAYPVVETVRHDGIRVEVLAPAPGLCDERAVRAQDLAIRIATELDVVGLLAVELFDTGTDLIVNELAMRPHTSAHWTVEGARTSQFEQHLRAVLDYPMGDTSLTAPFAVTVNVRGDPSVEMSIDERLHHTFAAAPSARIHLYGADAAPDRAIGHVTVLGDDFDQVRARARSAAILLRDGPRKATAAGG